MYSFDATRERPAPQILSGHTLDGQEWTATLHGLTLVVAVKPNCDGCREFVEGRVAAIDGVALVVVSETGDEEWRRLSRSVYVAPDVFRALEIRSAPFFVLVDAQRERVVREGSLFSAKQVKEEISSYLGA